MKSSSRIRELAFLSGIGPAFSLKAFAGPGVWTSFGPYGGDGPALAINPAAPSTLYAGTIHEGRRADIRLP